ncbi:MAG: bacteriohemerythrin [Candidatus Falkowbacteria bacterium]
MLINWSEINSVGVRELDEQHKKLVELINELSQMIHTLGNNEVLAKFVELKRLGDEHCAAEERYFEIFNYPEKEIHKIEHSLYTGKIEEYAKRYFAGDPKVIEEALEFSRKWWLEHINTIDHRYTKYFNEHGLY